MTTEISRPPFCVLMSVYLKDNAVFFDQALGSILTDQTLIPNQLVLVVDGPLDDAKNAIIERYQALQSDVLDVLRLPENVGQGPALNRGLLQCKHEYVARMDADDISLPDRFEKQVGFVSEHPDVDVSSGFVAEFDQNDFSRTRQVPLEMPGIVSFSKRRSPVNHGACMYKKSKVLTCGAYNSFAQVQDYALFVKMISSGAQFKNQSDILVRVRMYDGYARKASWKYFIEEVKLAWHFYSIGHIGVVDLVGNILVRAAPRLLGSRIIGFLYRRVLR